MAETNWLEKWRKNEIKFHLGHPHPLLVQHHNFQSPGRIIVPLCGKSVDLLWLMQQGHEVVGVEFSPIACEAFFTENQLPFKQTFVEDWNVFRGDKITLWCCDFFQLPANVWRGCTGIYDRAALVALDAETRKKYATHIGEMAHKIRTTFKNMLLVSVEYPQKKVEGPPYCVDQKEIQKLFKEFFNIQKLDAGVDESLTDRAEKFTGIEVAQTIYDLKLR